MRMDGKRDPTQKGDPWHGKLYAAAVGSVIWMGLLGLLYLYFVLTAPLELRQEKLDGPPPETTRNVPVVPRKPQ